MLVLCSSYKLGDNAAHGDSPDHPFLIIFFPFCNILTMATLAG
jgi:hypothetical protein